MIRALVVDDHEIVRRGLLSILTSESGLELELAEAGDVTEALKLLSTGEWDLILLDINLPGRNGLEVLEEVRRMKLKTRVLVLTSYPEEQFAIRALKAGAAAYLTKQSASDELLTAIERVLGGGRYVTAALAERLASRLSDPAESEVHHALSERELQVLRLVAVGKSSKEIADDLALSEKTIATYRTRITEKTGLKTAVEIARYALKQKLVE